VNSKLKVIGVFTHYQGLKIFYQILLTSVKIKSPLPKFFEK